MCMVPATRIDRVRNDKVRRKVGMEMELASRVEQRVFRWLGNIIIIIKIIIYHDFLPPPSRGSHVKSDNTHTIIQHTPLSP